MPPPEKPQKNLTVRIHDFKSNIAGYIRTLEEQDYDGLWLKRYNKHVAYVISVKSKFRDGQRGGKVGG